MSSIKRWSEDRTADPIDMDDTYAGKQMRILDPLVFPDLYAQFYDGNAQSVEVKTKNGVSLGQYELVQNYNNPETSSHFKLIADKDTGHHILIGKGMDLPGRDEGAGRMGAIEDLKQRTIGARYGSISDQVIDAEQIYLSLLEDPSVKSIEYAGYSIGSIPGNYLASVYGAQVTNMADLGVPEASLSVRAGRYFLGGNFAVAGHGLFPQAHGGFAKNLEENVVGLKLRYDLMGGALGAVGPQFGKILVLDGDEWLRLSGLAHVPQVYAKTVVDNYSDASHIEVTERHKMNNFFHREDLPGL